MAWQMQLLAHPLHMQEAVAVLLKDQELQAQEALAVAALGVDPAAPLLQRGQTVWAVVAERLITGQVRPAAPASSS